MKLTIKDLAARIDCPYEGDGDIVLTGVASLETAKSGDLVFLTSPKFRAMLEKTSASAVILPPGEPSPGIPVLRAADPQRAFVRATNLFYQPYRPEPGVHPTAVVSPSARIEKNVSIGALSVVGDGAEIGANCVIFPQVAIYPRVKIGEDTVVHSNTAIREDVRIGSRVVIHNGVVIGADGFGYLKAEDGGYIKIPQKGIVVIEDDVEIGANTTVDRAALGETIIRKGTKLDNLVMVAHNVEIGENAIIAAQTGIAGSTKVGRNVICGGQVGITDHATIGENAIIAAQTGVTGNLPPGAFVAGCPHLDIRVWRKFWALAPQMYDIVKDFKRLRARLDGREKT